MVGLSGVEPLTSRLSGARSNQLSYRPPRSRDPRHLALGSKRGCVTSKTRWALRARSSPERIRIAHVCVERTRDDLETRRRRASRDPEISRRRDELRLAPCHASPRKEVIQPHLPVRLPCYDLAPITGLTLGGYPPCGLAHRLRVLPTFVA